MPAWLLWLIAAAGLGVAELVTLDLVLLMFAGAALVAVLVALVGAPVVLQLLAFAAAGAALLVLVRPVARKHLQANAIERRDGVEVFVGRIGTVTESVDDRSGRIRIGGDEWTAVTRTPSERFAVGAQVRVMAIEGATAVVSGDMV